MEASTTSATTTGATPTTGGSHSTYPVVPVSPPKSLELDDCVCQHHSSSRNVGSGTAPNDTHNGQHSGGRHNHPSNHCLLVLEMEGDDDDWDDDDNNHSDNIDLELQAFARAEEEEDDDNDSLLVNNDDNDDDATASVTDSEDSWGGADDDDCSVSSLDADGSGGGRNTDDSSCSSSSLCSVYDDEQDIACLQQAAAATTSDQGGPHPKEVRFSTVEIREYAVTIGDHPCVRDSVPITLDWKYAKKHRRHIDSYENSRYFVRRSYPQKLTPQERRRRIRETSRISKQELEELEADLAAKRLQSTLTNMYEYWGNIDEMQDADPDGFWQGFNALEEV